MSHQDNFMKSFRRSPQRVKLVGESNSMYAFADDIALLNSQIRADIRRARETMIPKHLAPLHPEKKYVTISFAYPGELQFVWGSEILNFTFSPKTLSSFEARVERSGVPREDHEAFGVALVKEISQYKKIENERLRVYCCKLVSLNNPFDLEREDLISFRDHLCRVKKKRIETLLPKTKKDLAGYLWVIVEYGIQVGYLNRLIAMKGP